MRRKTPNQSITDSFRAIRNYLLIPLILFNIALASYSFVNIRRENRAQIMNTVNLYQDNLANHISAIENFTARTVTHEPDVASLETCSEESEMIPLLESIRSLSNSYLESLSEPFQYFLFFPRLSRFYNASSVYSSWEDYSAFRSFVMNALPPDDTLFRAWNTTTLDSGTYLYLARKSGNRILFATIRLEDLLSPLNSIALGRNGYIQIYSSSGNLLYSRGAEMPSAERSTLFYSYFIFNSINDRYSIRIYADNFSNYGRLLMVQVFFILLSLIAAVILSIYNYSLYRRVIRPIEAFSSALSSPSTETALINLQGNNIRELEIANTQFRNLIHEVKRLKISLYEKELEQNRSRIAFLQHQIKPHFYLNCLTTIDSMLALGEYENIQSMILFTSRYLRYLFQVDSEYVRLEYELSHIRAYLDIQTLRYGHVFTYNCMAEGVDNAMVPPLLLITFVENSIKHALVRTRQLEISLSVLRYRENNTDRLRIEISDSGPGFPEEFLTRITAQDRPGTAEDSHIGISNCIQRLNALYGSGYSLSFSNRAEGGARTLLEIPYRTSDNTSVRLSEDVIQG